MQAGMPAMESLPEVMTAEGWDWRAFGSDGFWVGTDLHGREWLIKMRGSLYAYREIVFGRVAQKFGWSHQSSTFALLPRDAPPVQAGNGAERVQAALWLLPEHRRESCGLGCPLHELNKINLSDPNLVLQRLSQSSITNLLDWPRAEIASYIFGANECTDRLFTTDHKLVTIDAEQYFASMPVAVQTNPWYSEHGEGFQITVNICQQVAALSDDGIKRLTAIPPSVRVKKSWNVEKILRSARDEARSFLNSHRIQLKADEGASPLSG